MISPGVLSSLPSQNGQKRPFCRCGVVSKSCGRLGAALGDDHPAADDRIFARSGMEE